MNTKGLSWKEVLLSGPGPENSKQILILILKGFIMGIADIIPGVSGGTMAFITGIYQKLVMAIASIDKKFITFVLKLEFKNALNYFHTKFLFPLVLGIGTAIIIMARPMNYFINYHKAPTLSLFFGLLSASIYVLLKEIENLKDLKRILSIFLGFLCGYLIVGLIPMTTPNTWWFILFCGAIGATAMILPGISGAFILLILGKYEYITSTLKNPFELQNFTIIIVFITGIITGLVGFSKLLKYLLEKKRQTTLCLLVGLMIGAMRKIWPWKIIEKTKIISNKVHILKESNIIPTEINPSFFLCLILMIVGIMLVIIIQKLAHHQE